MVCPVTKSPASPASDTTTRAHIERLAHTAERSQLRPRPRIIARLVLGSSRSRSRPGATQFTVMLYFPSSIAADLGEHLDAALAGRVIHQVRKRDLVAARPDVHDPAATPDRACAAPPAACTESSLSDSCGWSGPIPPPPDRAAASRSARRHCSPEYRGAGIARRPAAKIRSTSLATPTSPATAKARSGPCAPISATVASAPALSAP